MTDKIRSAIRRMLDENEACPDALRPSAYWTLAAYVGLLLDEETSEKAKIDAWLNQASPRTAEDEDKRKAVGWIVEFEIGDRFRSTLSGATGRVVDPPEGGLPPAWYAVQWDGSESTVYPPVMPVNVMRKIRSL